jgi:hypothetical protein
MPHPAAGEAIMEYRVNWNIEVDADSPREAAIEARKAQIRPGSTAVVFTVETGNPQGPESVDLLDLVEDAKDPNTEIARKLAEDLGLSFDAVHVVAPEGEPKFGFGWKVIEAILSRSPKAFQLFSGDPNAFRHFRRLHVTIEREMERLLLDTAKRDEMWESYSGRHAELVDYLRKQPTPTAIPPITDESDLATVLAALRLFQQTYEDCDSRTIAAAWPEHFQITGDGESDVNPPPLGTDDIDTLCEAINCTSSEPAEPAPNVGALLGAKLLEKFPWLADKNETDISGADTIQELTDLYEALEWEDEDPAPPTPRVIVVLEGGLVQDILTTVPMDAAVIDYDTEGAEEDELTQIPQDLPGMSENASLQSTAPACAGIRYVEVHPDRCNQLFEAIAIEPEPVEKQAPEN